MRVTRSVVLCAMFVGLATQAGAADLDWLSNPILRGSQTVSPVRPIYRPGTPVFRRWDGFYVGGQVGQSWATADFSNATRSMLSYILSNTELQNIVSDWTTLPKGSTGGQTFGGFIGYNTQWDEAILGFELNYNHMSLTTGAQDSLGPILVPGATLPDGSTVVYTVTATSTAAVAFHDVVTARLRGGWAFDRFMPYAFVGVAVGRVDVLRSASVTGTKTTTPPATIDPFTGLPTPGIPVTDPLFLPRSPQSQSQAGVFAYGYTAGIGLEMAIAQNLFVRGEWEFVYFPNISDFRVTMNSARLGLGVRF